MSLVAAVTESTRHVVCQPLTSPPHWSPFGSRSDPGGGRSPPLSSEPSAVPSAVPPAVPPSVPPSVPPAVPPPSSPPQAQSADITIHLGHAILVISIMGAFLLVHAHRGGPPRTAAAPRARRDLTGAYPDVHRKAPRFRIGPSARRHVGNRDDGIVKALGHEQRSGRPGDGDRRWWVWPLVTTGPTPPVATPRIATPFPGDPRPTSRGHALYAEGLLPHLRPYLRQ